MEFLHLNEMVFASACPSSQEAFHTDGIIRAVIVVAMRKNISRSHQGTQPTFFVVYQLSPSKSGSPAFFLTKRADSLPWVDLLREDNTPVSTVLGASYYAIFSYESAA